MTRRFEIYQDAENHRLVVPCGFSPTAAVLDWIWALWLRLWMEGLALFIVNGITTYLLYIGGAGWAAGLIVQAVQGICVGFAARKLRSMSAERRGYSYLCTVDAVDPAKLAALVKSETPAPAPEPVPSAPSPAPAKPVDLGKANEKLSGLLGGKKP